MQDFTVSPEKDSFAYLKIVVPGIIYRTRCFQLRFGDDLP